mgnify:CR=1 FL=1
MLQLYMSHMQVEQLRVNDEKARSMTSRVEALMQLLVVSLGWQLCTCLCQMCVDCKVHPDSLCTYVQWLYTDCHSCCKNARSNCTDAASAHQAGTFIFRLRYGQAWCHCVQQLNGLNWASTAQWQQSASHSKRTLCLLRMTGLSYVLTCLHVLLTVAVYIQQPADVAWGPS